MTLAGDATVMAGSGTVFLTAVACAFALGACGSPGSRWSELTRRPDIDEAVARYGELTNEIAGALSAKFGLPPWETADDRDPGCADFPEAAPGDALTSTRTSSTPARIPPDQWPRAAITVERTASAHGFTIDDLGSRSVSFHDAYAAKLTVDATSESTTIRVRTGCHLLPEAKQRASRAP
ncbi:LppA family lipoprotein [Amycolatopsis sp. 195334CR]|uniref:LppA family lipoprotein n=1 Tax=Amycolatopsis sp. 195334CR TaxID=2814588 RepID=UPI001A8E6921|nr:LppA family lipoprotein [Amycolatopsis sp. 195334CR]MBN6033425.1 hypothetical protein [Amycolatopsis sp. 195334CR]